MGFNVAALKDTNHAQEYLVSRILKVVVVTAVLACITVSFAFGAEQDVAKTPLGMDVVRGDDAAGDCRPYSPAAYDACISAARDKSHKQSGDMTAFDTGFYFHAWFATADLFTRLDAGISPRVATPLPDAAGWKLLAIKCIRAYVDARKKAGLTDDQVLHIMLMNPDVLKPLMAVDEKG